jgi:ribosome-binding protein aMBF1 (putative translation factor)
MRQVDLAKMLQVKESLIHHVESQQMQLSLVFAKKIEAALDIKLVKKFKE